MKANIAILDYGVGNIHSVRHACRQFSENVTVLSENAECGSATHFVLPGVGAFDVAISQIRNRKFDELIYRATKNQIPILGICIGMHVLARIGFENGSNHGLGVFDSEVKHLSELAMNTHIRIPHIGWSEVKPVKREAQSNSNPGISGYFYFAHSYGYFGLSEDRILSEISMGGLQLPAVVKSGNTFGVQFHPEKSGKNGLRFLKKFFETQQNIDAK